MLTNVSHDAGLAPSIRACLSSYRMEPRKCLAICSDEAFLDAATSVGLSTVFLRTDKRDWKTGRRSTYEIRDGELKNVQACVEELNGVSFRAASLL